MLYSIYNVTLKLIKNSIFGVKTSRFCHLLHIKWPSLCNFTKSVNHYWFFDFIACRYYHSPMQHHVKTNFMQLSC